MPQTDVLDPGFGNTVKKFTRNEFFKNPGHGCHRRGFSKFDPGLFQFLVLLFLLFQGVTELRIEA